MNKDLNDAMRETVEAWAQADAEGIHAHGQSLSLAREAWINAFDKAASELDPD